MAEEKDSDIPFDGPYRKVDKNTDPRKRAETLANKGMEKMAHAVRKAKDAGAKADTKIGDKTLGEMILAAGLTLEEFGFDPSQKPIAPANEPQGASKEDMEKFASGFYNREMKNFTIGGTGVKVKIDKEFPDASPEEKAEVFATIDHVDPSSSTHQKERIKKLSGLGNGSKIAHAQGVMESYLG